MFMFMRGKTAMRKLLVKLCTVLSLGILTACTVPVLYKDTLHKNCQVEQQIHQARTENSAFSPEDRVQSHFYTSNVYHSGQSPQWLNRRVSMRTNNLPLYLLMDKLLPPNTITTQYGAGANKNSLVSLNYTGSISGALTVIAAKTNYAYDIEDNMLTWSNIVTKTFDISFMPGASEYLMGQKSGDTMLNVNSGSGSSASSGQGTDSQFSSLQGNLSVWKDLQNSIEEMLSPDGKVMVSQSTTTISVQDHPENVQKVSDYLASMNKDLSREVSLQVKVLEVNLDKNFNYGIDWNLVYNSGTFGGGIGVGTGNLGQSTNPVALGGNSLGAGVSPRFPNGLTGTSSALPGIGAGILHGPFQNTQVLINALAQQGSVSTVTNPDVVTLNNQVAQIDISTQTGYLASTTTTVTGVESTVQTSLNPGMINTGFKLYILPKIMNHNVYLQLSSSLSTLDRITNFGTPGNQIQLPTVSGKHFNLRSMVPSGDTLIIAGFKQNVSTANKSTMFGSPLLGGKGADSDNIETIVLITPIIVGNNG
jgi:type IVB pilus formation R64 PilN family outer membrane protein